MLLSLLKLSHAYNALVLETFLFQQPWQDTHLILFAQRFQIYSVSYTYLTYLSACLQNIFYQGEQRQAKHTKIQKPTQRSHKNKVILYASEILLLMTAQQQAMLKLAILFLFKGQSQKIIMEVFHLPLGFYLLYLGINRSIRLLSHLLLLIA